MALDLLRVMLASWTALKPDVIIRSVEVGNGNRPLDPSEDHSSQICSAAISVCGKSMQWQPTLRLLQEMPRKLLQADLLQNFDVAISACEKGL